MSDAAIESEVVEIPDSLRQAVASLPGVTTEDAPHVRRLLTRPEYVTRAGIAWLAALVSRRGAKFDRLNSEHCTPHRWPLTHPTP